MEEKLTVLGFLLKQINIAYGHKSFPFQDESRDFSEAA